MLPKTIFLEAYILAHEKYRIIRYEQLREVTNAVWVAEALCNLGFKVTADDYRIKAALNVFFKAFVDTFELRDGAKKLLKKARTAMQSRLNLKLHSCTGHLLKPKTAGHKHVLQCGCSFRGELAGENQAQRFLKTP